MSTNGAARLSLARLVDQICDRFESAWKAVASGEEHPRIEDFLTDAPESER